MGRRSFVCIVASRADSTSGRRREQILSLLYESRFELSTSKRLSIRNPCRSTGRSGALEGPTQAMSELEGPTAARIHGRDDAPPSLPVKQAFVAR